ncbi:MAG: DUF3800 domain-containing protein [Chloroflexi bacterium]|nr:DUF3800 domain-containing protein [Chloroflexota bacterium]
MYAYIDESGNTGKNLFDPEQPTFTYGALVTKSDFDLECAKQVADVAEELGLEGLHAAELGMGRLEPIAGRLLTILTDAGAYTTVCRVKKVDLAVAKFVDVLFDSAENRAVAWHIYNLRPLRLFNVVKIAYLLDRALLREFWEGLMESNKDEVWRRVLPVLQEVLSRIGRLPDQRSREVTGQAMKWAIDNPEAISVYSSSKALRLGHLPSMAAFPELLGSIEMLSQEWQLPVKEIKHDRQSQFGSMLEEWHSIFSTATADPLVLPFGEKHVFRRVFGSKFTVCDSKSSCGIQIVDTVLWLLRRLEMGDRLPPKCLGILEYCNRNGYCWELSLGSIVESLNEFMSQLETVPLTVAQIEQAKERLSWAEKRRLDTMNEYNRDKSPG